MAIVKGGKGVLTLVWVLNRWSHGPSHGPAREATWCYGSSSRYVATIQLAACALSCPGAPSLHCMALLTYKLADAKPEPLQLGRADALNARTQQFLEITGILDELVAKGIPCNSKFTIGIRMVIIA